MIDEELFIQLFYNNIFKKYAGNDSYFQLMKHTEMIVIEMFPLSIRKYVEMIV